MKRFLFVFSRATAIFFLLFSISAGVARAAEYLEGMIEPSLEVRISSQVPGVIDEVLVERGDLVKKGQIVAKLRAGVEKADVELASVQVEFSKRKLARNQELFAQEHISANEKDEIETEMKKGEALLEEAAAKLEMRNIRSTVDGIVVKRDLAAGEYVGEKPILTVAKINPLNVEVVVPVGRYGSMTKGMLAEVRPEAPVGGSYTGKVVIVDRVVDAASGTFGIRIELPNPNLSLPAGLKCKVRFYRK
jgi:RND family efflux transporter MFP subunit